MTIGDRNPTAGIGDPYWYEWTVGQSYVIDMLNPDNNITSVTLQATQAQGLDDVVVGYINNSSEYVQVKHTRVEDTITFGEMLPLLRSMSKAWASQKSKWDRCVPVLFTNRIVSTSSTTMRPGRANSYIRPALNVFLEDMKLRLDAATTLTDIQVPQVWETAWEEWCEELTDLPTDEERVDFLKLLELRGNQPELDQLTNNVMDKIASTFAVSIEKAQTVFSQLDHALRIWGTTFRGSKELINIEDVYEALSVNSRELVGDHMLRPPALFFPSREQFIEEIAQELLSGPNPILFLSGLPGQGKTSIVSTLANRNDPVVDLRYHAFKPITPQTKCLPADAGLTTKPEVLWGDLLTQLRTYFFRGRLAKFKVPVKNEFLNLEQLITEVLRLADILGKERGRPTVIAIDGIDHAARAGVDHYSFLDTLIPPDDVPENVRFLISGQPTEAYTKYPFWLRQQTDGVLHRNVEGIQEEDISQLIKAECELLPADQVDTTIRLIQEVAQGNTLAAIFAVEEAKVFRNVEELYERLESRKLSNGVSAYYENIWSAAIDRLDRRFTFFGYRLAGCMSLINERVTGHDLTAIFTDLHNVTSHDWTEALRGLRPLVIEEPGGFRVTHNDVRVHLTKLVHSQPERLRETASLIADYYWREPDMVMARHNSLFELLRKSERHEDQARAFTPKYVMEGYANDQSLYELYGQYAFAIQNVVDTRDWECVHTLSCAAATLSQLDKSIDWIGGKKRQYLSDVPPMLFSEGRVQSKDIWTVDLVYQVMSDVLFLLKNRQQDRAFGLIRRWFTGITPVEMRKLLNKELMEDSHLESAFKDSLHMWGQVSYHTGLLWEGNREEFETPDRTEKEQWTYISNGMLEEAIRVGGVRDWIRSSKLSVYHSVVKLEANLMTLVDKRRWIEIAYSLKIWQESRSSLPISLKIKAAALSLFTGRLDLFRTWVQPLIKERYTNLESIDLKDQTLLYCMVSFVLGWVEPHRENSGIGQEALEAFYNKTRVDNRRAHFGLLLSGSALVGKWMGTYKRKGDETASLIVTSTEVKILLEGLLLQTRSYNDSAHYHNSATKLIVELLIECSSGIGGEVDQIVYTLISTHCKTHPANYMMEIGWRYLWNRGDVELLKDWFEALCGPEGEAWHIELANRVDIVNRLVELANEVGFEEEAKNARSLLKWGMIGYSGHKEYVLDSPVEWYKDLTKVDSNIWEYEGKLLLEINQQATEVGDNRSALYAETAVSNSVASQGPGALWRLLHATNMRVSMIDNELMLFNGVIMALETLNVSEEDLLSIWSFGIGILNWQDGNERCYLEDLRKAIVLAANRASIVSIEQKLKSLGEAEFETKGDSDRYRIPGRWFEDTSRSDNSDAPSGFLEFIKTLPFDSAKLSLAGLSNSSDDSVKFSKGIEFLADRLKIEKPHGYPIHLQSLVSYVLTRDNSNSWGKYKLDLAYKALIPLVNDSVKFDLLSKIISDLDIEHQEAYTLNATAEILDDFCRYRSTTIEDLTEGLRRTLLTNEVWILGNGFLPDMPRIVVPTLDEIGERPENWSGLAVRYFFKIINSNNLTRINLALRGLWSIAKCAPDDLKYIADRWGELNTSAKERVLLLVERLAAEVPSAYECFIGVVNECYKGHDLILKLQAWVILQTVELSTGEECPEFQISEHPDHQRLATLMRRDKGLLDVPSIARGLTYELRGNDIVRSLLNKLEVVTMEDLSDVERKVAAFIQIEDTILDEYYEPIAWKRGQMKARNLPQIASVMRVLYHEMSRGRWGDIPVGLFAQALLRSDEPFVLLNSSPSASDAEMWPVDYELEQFDGDKRKIAERIIPHIHSGLSDDEIVIGAILQTYSRSMDVELVYESVLRSKGFELFNVDGKSTMNGRSFSLYDIDRYDPLDVTDPVLTMTCKSGGYGEFVNQSILCYPTLIWSELFGWYPSDNNPFVWLEDDIPVVRFEQLHGKVRNIIQDQLYRQPFIQRWVCKKQTLEKLESRLGVPVNSVSRVNIRRIEQ
ncbi:hypothetical protein [Paenibacillus glycanilyticus]|uniref:ATP-binding protein n=1 Tax=Paenibacillus glycanilyticus TaxID=126569 RepID=A0ABQ6GDS6_9BACL|nr:hypothetical protein [Paenibacillus glycanilyticus]GLX68420.1 hypothetical protein MU1_27650 [Paenibacillus glycanilyticus]